MLRIKGSFERIFANQKVALFIGSLDKFFIKLPHLPIKFRTLINKIIPFLVLFFGLIGLVATLASGLFLGLAIISLDSTIILELITGFLIVLLDTLFLLKAFKPLRQGSAVGWIYLFWAEILEVVNFIIRIFNSEINILLNLLTIILSFYLLFEIGQFYVYKNTNQKS